MACGSCRFPQAAAARNTCPVSMADQWNNTGHNVLCGIIYYGLCIYSLFAKAIRFGNQLEPPPPQEERPQSVDNEVLRRRLRGVLISQVRAFAHVFTCPMRVVTEWPLLFPSCSQSGLSSSLAVLLPHLIFFLLLRQHSLLLPLAWQTFHLVPFSSCNLFVSTWTNIACILDKSKQR